MNGVNSIRTFAIFAILALMAQAFAAAPLLQITDYSTTPSDVYPGTLGYLKATLSNKGDADAKSINAYYDIDGVSRTMSISDIGIGSSAQIAVPFRIGQESAGSIQVLDLTVFYSYDAGSGLSSKKTALSVPLTVKQYRPLEVQTSMEDASIAPGEKIPMSVKITNVGGVVNNLVISAPANSTFSIDGATQKSLGSIARNVSVNVTLVLASSSEAATGTYGVPLIFSYQDSLQQPTEETLYVGPVSVLSSSTQYRVELVPLETVEIGAEVPFLFRLTNSGSSPFSGTLDVNSTDVFTPIGMQKIYFDDVPVGATVERNITLGVLATKSAGYYTMPITLSPNAGQPVRYNIGIAVEATPEITVKLESTGATPQIQVANTGNAQIRSVYASATPSGAQVASENFMGTLNVDDFATLSLDAGSTGKSIDVEVRYRDTNNVQHTMKKTLTPVAGNSSFSQQGARQAIGGTNSAAAAGAAARGQNNNPLGFLMGGRQGATTGGFGILPWIIGAVIVVVVGFFGYRKFFAKKGAAKAAPETKAKK